MGGRECVRPRSNSSAVGYIRVSTEEQTLGPEAQRVALQRWADARGLTLVAVHEDRCVSGAAPLDRRPSLLAALASLATHAAAYLVAAKRDRLARDVVIAAQLERLVERQGAQLVSADGAGEGDSPEAALMRRLVDAVASYERDLIRGRTRGEVSTPPSPSPWRPRAARRHARHRQDSFSCSADARLPATRSAQCGLLTLPARLLKGPSRSSRNGVRLRAPDRATVVPLGFSSADLLGLFLPNHF